MEKPERWSRSANCYRVMLLFFFLSGLRAAFATTEIDSLMTIMSPEEKIGQMILVYHSPYEFLEKYKIGGVLIMSNMLKHPETLKNKLGIIQRKLPVGLLVAVDQEGGKVNRLRAIKGWERVASARDLSTYSADSIVTYTGRIARQLKHLNINVNLAPILDPSHNWKGDASFMYVRNRTFGRTAEEIIPPAKSFIRGFSQTGILCISKHFPGYDVATNSDSSIAVSQADSQAVREYARAFSGAMDGVGGVLMSSVLFESFCDKPSVFSPQIVGWARGMGEDKLIITDDLWGMALRKFVSPGKKVHHVHYPDEDFARLVKLAFWAGNDILMITFPKKVEIIQATLLDLVKTDPSAEKRLNESVRRILLAKQGLGLINGAR
ncbi:glycoside hydrolase family 3 N-terminal domain-containing protein [Fibrobacterota bacterium]